ncbi:hypothetical protein BRO54_1275 [Geobacillus proteiniphilus]|uniref:Uncharacterized protein n=1 Tax=Geobacillus proteiniphilus TaxID=860353 RepID=A0A1Q5T3Q1_9BACL|nr:hypothetical protein BRO54_1275 [Geobacillus proteiniphilus]
MRCRNETIPQRFACALGPFFALAVKSIGWLMNHLVFFRTDSL